MMDDNSSSFSESSDFEDFKKKCSWCTNYCKLVKGKSYCQKCEDECYKECRRCKRPFPNARFFEFDETRCNTCHGKYKKEKEKRMAKKETPQQPQKDMRSQPQMVMTKQTCKKPKLSSNDENPTDVKETNETPTPTKSSRKRKRGFIPVYFIDEMSDDDDFPFLKNFINFG